MTVRTQPSEIRLLAQGILPYQTAQRALCDPVAYRLQVFRQLSGLGEPAEIVELGFRGALDMRLHPVELGSEWRRLRAICEVPTLVYLHRGQQQDTRCPILQQLLNTLDHRGPVHALRVETRQALRDMLALTPALAARAGD